jgi:hypothetical protein
LGCQTGEKNAECRSCDAGCRRIRACRWVGHFGGTGQWRSYCRIWALGRPRHAGPRHMRARPAPEFWTLRPWMRTRLVPTVSAGTLPAQVIGSGFPALVPTSHVPKDSATMTISMYKARLPSSYNFSLACRRCWTRPPPTPKRRRLILRWLLNVWRTGAETFASRARWPHLQLCGFRPTPDG